MELVEDTGKVDLTDEEKAEGLQYEWVSIEMALDQMRRVQPTSELGNSSRSVIVFSWKRLSHVGRWDGTG